MTIDLDFSAQLDVHMEGILTRHSRIALQFSGGKDSTACLYLLHPWLEHITVYWVNAGDEFPETQEIVDFVRSFIPRFFEVKSDSPAWRSEYGLPSDLIPAGQNPVGRSVQHPPPRLKISDPYVCCASNYMAPLHQRMIRDDITCIIRGQKRTDKHRGPLISGAFLEGFEFFYPIEEWADAQVLRYLTSVGAPIHECYQYGLDGANCMTCTAWWEGSQHIFRAAKYPTTHKKVDDDLAEIMQEVMTKLVPVFSAERAK